MAQFNPDIQDTGVADMTQRSRGGGANRSFEALFSGIGDALSNGVNTADNYIKNRIEDQARYGLDNLNEGTNSALEQAAGATQSALSGKAPGANVPSAITQSGQSLQNLAMARDQGKITNEFYYQQLTSQLKSLRSRYPGYEKEVDSIVQQVTGVRPANAYREALLSRIQSDNQALQTQQNKFETWKNQNAGYIQMSYPDYFTNPDKYAGRENELQAGVARIKGQEQQFDFEVKANQNNQTVLQQKLGDRLSQISQNLLSGTTKAAGLDLPSFVSTLTNAGNGPGLSNDQLASLNGQFDQFVFNARTLLMTEANRPELGMISPTQKQQYVDSALQPILQIKDLLANKQYDQAARIAARNEALQNQGLSDMYKSRPELAAAVGVGKVAPEIGQYIVQEAIKNMGGVQNYVKGTAVGDQVGEVISGSDTLSDVNGRVINSNNLNQAEKNQLVSATVNTSLNAIREGKVSPDQISQFVQNNYNNDKDIFKQVTGDQPDSGQSQYLKLYTKVFDPKITDQIAKTGDQKLINQYFDYAVDKFRQIPEIRRAMNTVSQNVDYSDFFRAYYDESRNRVVIEQDKNAYDNMGSAKSGVSRIMLQQTVKAASALNQALSVMSPIIESSGQNETQVVQDLIGTLGTEGSGRGFFDWVRNSIDNSIKQVERRKTGSVDKPTGNYSEVDTGTPVAPDQEEVQYNIPEDAGRKWVNSSQFGGGTNKEVVDYVRNKAVELGIDPDIALRVANHEGLRVFDPNKPDNGGDEGSSFGPFQLHYSGISRSMPRAGLGDEFTKATGLHARDSSTWRQQIDFALNYAKNNGWGPWMGARAEGIYGFDGIKR